MSRKPRQLQVVPNQPHHLLLRGNNRRNLFSNAHDRHQFVRFMQDAKGAHLCAVHALALMTNHVHLVLTPDGFDVLWRWVKSFAQRYAVHRNRARGGSGKVFEQRYALVVIHSERQLAATTAYVDLNPMRAGLSDRWATFGLHAGCVAVPEVVSQLWRPSAWWLSIGHDNVSRHAAYREFAVRRWDAWQGDVVQPVLAGSPSHLYPRAIRPGGARAADQRAAYLPSNRNTTEFDGLDDDLRLVRGSRVIHPVGTK